MRHVPTALYIDTETFFRNGFRFDTSEFRAIRETFLKGGIRLLVPLMMERELLRHFRRRAKEVADKVSNAHNDHLIRSLSLSLPSRPELEQQCFDALRNEWEAFKDHFTVERLPLIGKLEDVVDWYFAIDAPFSEKKAKEFPDAFILSALEAYYQEYSARIAVVSGDGDFTTACARRRNISHFRDVKSFVDAFKPELTKSDSGEPIDPTKPITTEDLTEMKMILGRGAEVTVIERNRVLNLISTRGSNYEYFFRNANEAFWIDDLSERGCFSNPPLPEKLDNGGIRMPLWWPMEYLVRVYVKAPEKVVEIVELLPETNNSRILEGILEIILNSEDPALIKKFYGRIDTYLNFPL